MKQFSVHGGFLAGDSPRLQATHHFPDGGRPEGTEGIALRLQAGSQIHLPSSSTSTELDDSPQPLLQLQLPQINEVCARHSLRCWPRCSCVPSHCPRKSSFARLDPFTAGVIGVVMGAATEGLPENQPLQAQPGLTSNKKRGILTPLMIWCRDLA